MVVYNTHDDGEREAGYIRTAIERWVDGILFVSAGDQMASLAAIEAAGIPAVAIDRVPEGYAGPSLTIDNFKGGHMATEHLIGLGHQQIVHISGPLGLRLARERLEGFRHALAEHRLSFGPSTESEGWSAEMGRRAMFQLLESRPRPTAIFAASDCIAIGAMQVAWKAGLRVPDDLSIVGFDDIELAAFQIPPLTTIRQSFSLLATTGLQMLLDKIAEREPEPTQIVLEPTLIVRESTAPCRGQGS